MEEVVETDVLQMLEENYQQAKNELRDLDHVALVAFRSLNDKTSSGDFDIERYRDLKRKRQASLPILEQKLLRERIRCLQERREQSQRELKDLQPELVKTKSIVNEAMKVLDRAWQAHARVELKMASLESSLAIDFENLRSDQRALQSLIGKITGINEEE